MAAKFPEDAVDLGGGVELENTDDLLNCSICTEQFTDPKVLPCHHTFCSGCLGKYYTAYQQDGTQDPDRLPCPVCRTMVTVPLSGVTQIREAKTEPIQELVTKIASSKPLPKAKCDVCKYRKQDVKARDYCSSCNINYCDSCRQEHDAHALFRSHSVVPVAEADKAFIKCESHDAENVRYYCVSCMAPLCTVCALSEHKHHNTLTLDDAMGTKKENIEQYIGDMSSRVMQYEELLLQVEDIVSVREAAVKKTKLEIERHTSYLINQLNIRKQRLIEDLDRDYAAGTKGVNMEKENVQFQLANMKSLWKFAAKLTEPSQAIQLIAMHGDLMKMVEGAVKAPEPGLNKDIIAMKMFLPKENLNVGELQKCELSQELLTRVFTETHNGYASPRAASPVNITPYRFYEELTLKWLTPKVYWKVDKVGAKLGEISEAYDVQMLNNGNIVVAEWLSQRLQIFDSTGYSKELIGQGQIQPWGVCVTKDGNLVATDEKDRTVKFFNQSGVCIGSWRKQMFGWPRGVVVNSGGQYIVTDNQHGKHTVSLHLPDGKCIRQFGSQGSGNEQFHWPRYVTVDAQDRIIVADSSNHCIKVLDPTGHFLYKFGSIGSNDGHMKHPRGVCVDPNNNIMVADQDNNRVSLFSPEGRFIRHVVPSISKPWGISVNEQGMLAVTQKTALTMFKVFDPMP